jgi:hypothetical protein
MIEKIEGTRVYWDGHHLYSKNSKEIAVHPDLEQFLPNFELDGILRGNSVKLSEPQIVICDAPGLSENYECRMKQLSSWQWSNNISVVPYLLCRHSKFLQKVI